ncbi:MAG: AAA family ATPase [Magnetococcales bacterium]|nr:AAA family ATPase [Magnetococcales bacterium]MBF0150082.1 AAA family ATPase [Magnetococcales bacterium]
MYLEFFNLHEPPFSITPDPRFLFLGRHHREALAHLLYSVLGSSGFILLTGEVGSGKTTVSRCLIRQTSEGVDVALIFNPRLSALELIASICDELKISYPETATLKTLYDVLNQHLLNSHANHRNTVLILDEAQNLSVDLLEQVRLLSNLETDRKKLLQIILIGQPELMAIMARPEMRQFNQRVTARYHIAPLSAGECREFIRHRLSVAGCTRPVFSLMACWIIHHAAKGIPRQINQMCDRALLGSYTLGRQQVDGWIAYTAVREVLGGGVRRPVRHGVWMLLLFLGLTVGLVVFMRYDRGVEFLLEVTRVVRMVMANFNHFEGPSSTGVNSDVVVRGRKDDETYTSEPDLTPSAMTTDLATMLRVHGEEETSQKAALSILFGMWGVTADQSEERLCEWALSVGLACHDTVGNWDTLRQLGVPVVIRVTHPSHKSQHMVVSALGKKKIALNFGRREEIVSIDEIEQWMLDPHVMGWPWVNLFEDKAIHLKRFVHKRENTLNSGRLLMFLPIRVLWRLTPEKRKYLSAGMSGRDIVWLRSQIARLQKKNMGDEESDQYDARLLQQVQQFQEQYLLESNGIVGMRFLLTLDLALQDADRPTPRLRFLFDGN